MDNTLKNIVRVGRISSINPSRCTARVLFDAQGIVSYDLQIIVPQTLKNKDYYLPDVGEHVVCLFLPTGNAEGFVLGAVYTDTEQVPVNNPDKRTMRFADGTVIEYDRATHTLNIDAAGPITLTTTGEVKIMAAANVNVTGDVIADGISLKEHVHPENDSGGPTGPPE